MPISNKLPDGLKEVRHYHCRRYDFHLNLSRSTLSIFYVQAGQQLALSRPGWRKRTPASRCSSLKEACKPECVWSAEFEVGGSGKSLPKMFWLGVNVWDNFPLTAIGVLQDAPTQILTRTQSIAPENVAANTMNTALLIGEKAADIFIKELGLGNDFLPVNGHTNGVNGTSGVKTNGLNGTH